MYAFIQQGCIIFCIIDSKDIYVTEKVLFFWTFFSSEMNKIKCITVSTKILGSTTVFNVDNNQKFLEYQISILLWFLKIMWHCNDVKSNDAEFSFASQE